MTGCVDSVLQRLLWSEMKDPAEFRAYLKRAGYQITFVDDADTKPVKGPAG